MTIAGHDRGREALARPADDEPDAGLHPVALERPVAIDQGDDPARCDRQHRKERREGAERHPVLGEERRQHAAGQRDREA